MKTKKYLLDTHALLFWYLQREVSPEFIEYFDRQAENGNVYVSTVSMWEIALLKKKGRIEIEEIHQWKDELLLHSPAKFIEPSISDMIDSTLLPDHHKDPFDRLLIAHATNTGACLVTRDKLISNYSVETVWM